METPDLSGLVDGEEVLIRFVCPHDREVWDVWVTAVKLGEHVSLNASTPGGTICPDCGRRGRPADY